MISWGMGRLEGQHQDWRARETYAGRASVRAWLYRTPPTPDARLVSRESIELAFIVAIQCSPAKQRAGPNPPARRVQQENGLVTRSVRLCHGDFLPYHDVLTNQ